MWLPTALGSIVYPKQEVFPGLMPLLNFAAGGLPLDDADAAAFDELPLVGWA